jgi:4-hydroxymandelate oxidase
MTVRLARVTTRTFAADSASAADPALRGFVRDLVAPYGLAVREDLFTAAAGHSYGEMAELLARDVLTLESSAVAGRGITEQSVDLLIVAHAAPDVIPGRATATYLSSVCPGAPFAFAVCDQGMASPFTALRIAHAYLDSGESQRALVLVLEQSALHHVPSTPVRLPDGHHAAALLLTTRAGAELAAPVVWPGVSPSDAMALLDAELTGGRAVVLGAELAALVAAAGLPITARVAPAGRPLTGPWATLGAAKGPALVADYDPALRYLCLANVSGES